MHVVSQVYCYLQPEFVQFHVRHRKVKSLGESVQRLRSVHNEKSELLRPEYLLILTSSLQQTVCVWFRFVSLKPQRRFVYVAQLQRAFKGVFHHFPMSSRALWETTYCAAELFVCLLRCFYFVDRLEGCQRTCEVFTNYCCQNLLFFYVRSLNQPQD